ncbi:MAG: LON peptidase substrate-binding domain-containing protein, partial [Anaerolineales bacterium]|nr:LON peptidase substrate-binding domain-containing protein [Anaerolineales bacterium]
MQIFTGKKEPEPEEAKKEQENNPNIPNELPILPLRGTVVYPLTVIPLNVGQPRSIKLVDEAATSATRMIALVTMKEDKAEEAGPDDVFNVGTVAIIHRLLRAPDNTVRLIVQGIERVRIQEFTTTEPYLKARLEILPD